MGETIAGVRIPDSALAREATELVRDVAAPLLFDHSRRVFLFGSLRGLEAGLQFDPELLYVGAMFHDLGLTDRYRRTDQRFEIDGADEARRFLHAHGVTGELARPGLDGGRPAHHPGDPPPHGTRGRAGHPRRGTGRPRHRLPRRLRRAARRRRRGPPRPDFKNRILAAFTKGIQDRPETTFGNVKADVLAHYVPDFVPGDFVEVIKNSDWPE